MMTGLSILIEGIDLAGKSTLATALPGKLQEFGFAIRQSRNALCPDNPIAQIADAIRKDPSASNDETGSLFLASHLWDARHYSSPPNGTIHLQDSCWVRTLAHHNLQGTPSMPANLRRVASTFPQFDVAVFLTANLAVRQARLHQRELEAPGSNDHGDRLVINNPKKFMQLDCELYTLCKEFFGAIPIDTSELSRNEVLNAALETIISRISLKNVSGANVR